MNLGPALTELIFRPIFNWLINFTEKRLSSSKKNVIVPIQNKEYKRFILIQKSSFHYLKEMMKEFGEISGGNNYKIYEFLIAVSEDWFVIKVDENLSFWSYHNLIGWFLGNEFNNATARFSIGYSQHKNDLNKDYVCFLKNIDEDELIGTFKNNKSFFINLPNAFNETGNLTLTQKIKVDMEEIMKNILENGLDITKIEDLEYNKFESKFYE